MMLDFASLLSTILYPVCSHKSSHVLSPSHRLPAHSQDIDAEVLASRSNEILTAIIHGMKRDEPSSHVRLAATNALLNSLEFTKSNFEKDVSAGRWGVRWPG